ncbi:MAG: hypothetical protein WCJ47_00815 [Methanomicrobiales archaeon]
MTRPIVEIMVVKLYYPREHDNRVLAIEIFLQITNAGEIVVRKKRNWIFCSKTDEHKIED